MQYRASNGHEVVRVLERLHAARKLIARHLAIQRHKQALDEEKREATRDVRRHHVGLNIA